MHQDSIQKSNENEENFCKSLKFTSFHTIQKENKNIITFCVSGLHNKSISQRCDNNYLSIDDDALSELILELKERSKLNTFNKIQMITDKNTETNLHVQPHILDSEKIAIVVTNNYTQTNISK